MTGSEQATERKTMTLHVRKEADGSGYEIRLAAFGRVALCPVSAKLIDGDDNEPGFSLVRQALGQPDGLTLPEPPSLDELPWLLRFILGEA